MKFEERLSYWPIAPRLVILLLHLFRAKFMNITAIVHRNKFCIVKLLSDLRILTQLQLVGVGVDFVFPLEEEEGRKKEGTHT